jgi:ubiquinone/menaquinone biosynthesis C-methylase UbiE
MIIYGLMKYIEKIPMRYDWMMNILTLGALNQGHQILLSEVRDGMEIMDVGCGTGKFAIEAARRGAKVTAVDANPQMLEMLRKKSQSIKTPHPIEIHECGSASIGARFAGRNFSLITASMMLGELPAPILRKTIEGIAQSLAPQGKFLISDELWPESPLGSFFYHILFWIFFIPNFILTRTLIIPVKHLPSELTRAGLDIIINKRLHGSAVTILQCQRKPE